MTREVILRMTGADYEALLAHVLPDDGREGVSLALCGRAARENRDILSVCRLVHVPHAQCERTEESVRWPTNELARVLEEAENEELAVVKVHGHPGGFDHFSERDDASDAAFFETCHNWSLAADGWSGSVVLLPGGAAFGRISVGGRDPIAVDRIAVCGDRIFFPASPRAPAPAFAERHAQAFGEATAEVLAGLNVAVVGCSGTGSPTVEQLFRLGVRRIVAVDPEPVEEVNLNRVIHSTRSDADGGVAKVEVLGRAVRDAGLGTEWSAVEGDLLDPETVRAVSGCDVIFGCVDSVLARHVLNKIASTYLIPYFDIGIRLVADGRGGVSHVTGGVNYLLPGGSSLLGRGVYTMKEVADEGLRWSDPEEFERRRGEGYVSGAAVARPAVLPVNMIFSGLGAGDIRRCPIVLSA